MINGDKGRLELEVVESAFRLPKNKGGSAEGAVHGEKALPNEGRQKIILHPLWETPQEVPYEIGKGRHGESSSRRVVSSRVCSVSLLSSESTLQCPVPEWTRATVTSRHRMIPLVCKQR
jgi:hypothetical protein